MTGRCPDCGQPGWLNAHYGVCQPCVLHAKKIARAFFDEGETSPAGRALVAASSPVRVATARQLYASMRAARRMGVEVRP